MQGRNNKAANVVERVADAPICRNISKATKVTMAEGISSAAKSVLIQIPGFIQLVASCYQDASLGRLAAEYQSVYEWMVCLLGVRAPLRTC